MNITDCNRSVILVVMTFKSGTSTSGMFETRQIYNGFIYRLLKFFAMDTGTRTSSAFKISLISKWDCGISFLQAAQRCHGRLMFEKGKPQMPLGLSSKQCSSVDPGIYGVHLFFFLFAWLRRRTGELWELPFLTIGLALRHIQYSVRFSAITIKSSIIGFNWHSHLRSTWFY